MPKNPLINKPNPRLDPWLDQNYDDFYGSEEPQEYYSDANRALYLNSAAMNESAPNFGHKPNGLGGLYLPKPESWLGRYERIEAKHPRLRFDTEKRRLTDPRMRDPDTKGALYVGTPRRFRAERRDDTLEGVQTILHHEDIHRSQHLLGGEAGAGGHLNAESFHDIHERNQDLADHLRENGYEKAGPELFAIEGGAHLGSGDPYALLEKVSGPRQEERLNHFLLDYARRIIEEHGPDALKRMLLLEQDAPLFGPNPKITTNRVLGEWEDFLRLNRRPPQRFELGVSKSARDNGKGVRTICAAISALDMVGQHDFADLLDHALSVMAR